MRPNLINAENIITFSDNNVLIFFFWGGGNIFRGLKDIFWEYLIIFGGKSLFGTVSKATHLRYIFKSILSGFD